MPQGWYSLTQNKDSKSAYAAELFVYDEIGGWGVTAAQLIGQLKGIKGRLLLRLNTPGGSVFEAVALYNYLKGRKDGVDTIVDGWALSAGSLLMLAGETRSMGEACMVMVHSAWGMAVGNGDDMRKQADLLDKVNAQLKTIYISRTGQDDETVAGWLSTTDGIWLDAAEAMALGFATETFESAKVAAHFDPRQIAAKYRAPKGALCVFENEPTQDEMKQIEELQAQLAAAQERITGLESKWAEATESLTAMDADLSLATGRAETAEAAKADLESQISAAASELAAVQAQLADSCAQYNGTLAKLITTEGALALADASVKTLEETLSTERRAHVEAHIDAMIAAKRIAAEAKPALIEACLAVADHGRALLAAIPDPVGHPGMIAVGMAPAASATVTRAQFEAMSQRERAAFFRTGGRISN